MMRMMRAAAIAALPLLALPVQTAAAQTRSAAEAPSPWVDGPDAPAPSENKPVSTAPREPGAVDEPLVDPPRAPDPRKPPLVSALPEPSPSLRFGTARTRAELARNASLGLEGTLFDVPGLWLQRHQAGAAQPSARGLATGHLGVVVDDVPLLTLGGLIEPLEVLTLDGSARLTMHNGPRVLTRARTAAAGVLSMSTAPTPKDAGEALDVDGVLAGGIGGAHLEKGVLAAVESGLHRARVSLHGSLINREDQRQGRSFVPFGLGEPVDAPRAGLLVRSGGNGGAAGVRADVLALPRLQVFQSWHSARAVDVPRPARCGESDDVGRAADCVRTLERGVDLWVAGGDAAVDLFGVAAVARPRVSIQRAVAHEERSGTRVTAVDRVRDEGLGATASLEGELALPRIALLDVWQPRVRVQVDGARERVSSASFSRSLRPRDAEPPGDGVADPTRARLVDGATTQTASLGAELAAHGSRVSLSAEGRLRSVALTAPAVDGRTAAVDVHAWAPQGALTARARVVEGVSLFAAVVHTDEPADLAALRGAEIGDAAVLPADVDVARFIDNTLELGGRVEGAFYALEGVSFASSRSGRLTAFAIPDDAASRRRWGRGDTEHALGIEGRGHLALGVDGVVAQGTASAVLIDEGPLLDLSARAPRAGVLNPLATLALTYAPPSWPFGGFVRARGILPHARLSPAEELDGALCPEAPSPDDVALGAQRLVPCSGAEGALLLDIGAHLQLGRVRVDVAGQNLLDREGKVRAETVGSGGLAISALVSVGL